jgi:hypothetical protein
MGLNLFILGMVIAVFGISLFLPARSARKRDQAFEAWPTAKGTVISCEVVPQPPLNKAGREILQYDVDVKYQFRTGGQLHFGSSLSLPRYLYGKDEAERIAARYPAGSEVAVHHNPDEVRECYLEIQKTAKYYRTSIVLIAAGALLFVLGFLTGLV